MSRVKCLSGCGRQFLFHFLLMDRESQSVYRMKRLFDDGKTYRKISLRISDGMRSNGGYVSKGDMVSASDICFSTLSLDRRSRRRRRISSVGLGVGAIYTHVSATKDHKYGMT